MGIELLRSQLADCYIKNLSFDEVLQQFPQANIEIYTEVAKEVEDTLSAAQQQCIPKEYYKGIGVEGDLHLDGLMVTDVYKACPASNLGLKVGDIITKVNFQKLTNLSLQNALNKLRNSEYEGGIILEMLRGGEIMTLGYGINAQPIFIDTKRKYPMNFTALTLGKRIKLMAASNYGALPVLELSSLGRGI